MEISIVRLKWKDRIENEIRLVTKVADVTRIARKLKWNWAGHTLRDTDKLSKCLIPECTEQTTQEEAEETLNRRRAEIAVDREE